MNKTVYDMMLERMLPWYLILMAAIVILFIFLMYINTSIQNLDKQHKYMEDQILELLENKRNSEE